MSLLKPDRGENIHLAFVKFELLLALQVHTKRDAVGNFGSSLFYQGQSHLTLPASHPLGPQYRLTLSHLSYHKGEE